MTTTRFMRADPGVGSPAAPVGTEAWAQRIRLTLQSHLKEIPKEPSFVKGHFDLVHTHRAWTLMNKPDGTYFRTFDEFCEHKTPWGLGKPWREIEAMLAPFVGKRTLQLVTAPVETDARETREHDEAGRFTKDNHSPHDAEKGSKRRGTPERVQAILRAPQQIQKLYTEGQIGQVQAARLGPRPPKRGLDPDTAARIAETTQRVLSMVSEGADARQVNRYVDTALRGERKPEERILKMLDGLDIEALNAVLRKAQELIQERKSR